MDEDFDPFDPRNDPARSLGIIGLIVSLSGIFFALIGLAGAITSTVAVVRSRKAGYTNRFGIAGIIVGLVLFVLGAYLILFGRLPIPGG